MNIRPATFDDADRLFRWRNDPATRAASVQYDLVECVQHHQWLLNRLAMKEPNLFIFEVNSVAVGTFRIDDGKLSYTIASEHRGKGHGTEMLRMIFNKYGPLVAEIYSDNTASIKAAKKAGMNVVLIERSSE